VNQQSVVGILARARACTMPTPWCATRDAAHSDKSVTGRPVSIAAGSGGGPNHRVPLTPPER
jgi:hypothetical protein